MAKQPEDKQTLELIEAPKKRGRPATGNAKTAAERMKEMRRRDKVNGNATVKLDSAEIAITLVSLEAAYMNDNGTWRNENAKRLHEKLKCA
ncbi:hypothetical protein [Silvimonas amylolytica]|uniref:Uncharacterized protein n=1 Tax=Silvimonas amylolytica TaxID=449663 RepID=A0ABQ2PGQ1_9NEIS|nr:hypothetical protein [Silvimonas amylolytica]GGP24426.1 hypothetical protein GCM10010971_02450 [Silvimonas amylolytica]GGP28335.1 hypothetical protein GCM10010971_41540 [Silvimonas amylolytica]